MKWFLLVLVLLGGAGFGAWRWQQAREYKHKWEAIVMPDRMARVLQPQSVEKLAELLQSSKKVRDASAFVEAAREIGLKKVAAGGYSLPKLAGPRDLAKAFNQAPDYTKVTFPEGFTGAKMAARLAAKSFSAVTEFRKLIYPAKVAVSPWEGKLFPDTYELPRHGDAKELISVLNERFNDVMKGFPISKQQMPRGAKGKTLTQNEIVTLASLVERETGESSERPLIAGILLNRLRQTKPPMRLQCDASVQYVRERAAAQGKLDTGHKEKLVVKDLWLDSPYNTYRHFGLPPGPICNPGKSALLAALQPRASKYLFYVMSPKLKRHRFAVTFAEHLKNKALAAQESKALVPVEAKM